MALNYSHQFMFPTHVSEDNLGLNGYFGKGISDKRDEGFGWPRRGNGEHEGSFDYSSERVERYGSPDMEDIVDLLPADPFGMDMSTTIAAINGWLEDLEGDYGGCRRSRVGSCIEEYDLFPDLNFMWRDAMKFQSSHVQVDGERNRPTPTNGYVAERDRKDAMDRYCLGSACNETDVVGQTKEEAGGATSSSGEDEGTPHEALFFALGYLGVKDLLNVERVCRSLRFTVKNDPLLWKTIHIEKPLNEISDDVLLQLTSRAQGNLQCLSLLECIRITDEGLRRVLEANPRLTKLSVPACTRLSIEGVVNILRSFNCNRDRTGIKHLRIGGLYGVTHEHVEELKYLLGADGQEQQNIYKPHFFSRDNLYRLGDDNRAIDVQVCPRCENVSLVYDCPAVCCQVKDQDTQECRACSVCILRCIQCGRCINNSEYEETFCLELLCCDCFKEHVKCEDKQEDMLLPMGRAKL